VNRDLIQSPAFVHAAKRFVRKNPPAVEAIRSALRLLSEDAFDPRLRTHKLKGDLAGCWASSAGYDLRIVFEFVPHGEGEAILLLSIGTHDEVY
jgi:mRNA-degrading endonuclease YafQ of YafQ-DinJ toxin-antitoxin module